MKRDKAVILLEALLLGQEVTLGDSTYAIVDNNLCISAEINGEECYISYEMSMNRFIEEANSLSDDEIFILAAQSALTKMRRRRSLKV